MPRDIHAHTAFISSPNDVSAERRTLSQIIMELNEIYLTASSNVIWPIMWEKMSGGLGIDGQDVINRQTDKFDIFIGILWSRFGTPTRRFGSGTEEEFENALQSHSASLNGVEFMIFVKTADLPRNIDLDQVRQLRQFVERMKKVGILYHQFRDEREFEEVARRHLLRYLAAKKGRTTTAGIEISSPANLAQVLSQRPARSLLSVVSRFSSALTDIVQKLSSPQKALRDEGRGEFHSATVELIADGGQCVRRIIDWAFIYGRTCYSELMPLCAPDERDKITMEIGGICKQIEEWRELLSKAPLLDPQIASEFATAREFMDYCVCALQTSLYGISGNRHPQN